MTTIAEMPAKYLRCESGWDGRPGYTICKQPVTHIEVWNGHEWPPDHRFWCEEHVPMSGHFEWCGYGGSQCERLLKEYAVRRDLALECGEVK